MAKYYSSTFGKISGKHGTAVAVIMKDGTTYLREYRKPSNPRTDKQQAHRAKFALSSRALVPFNPIFKETLGITNGISIARSHAFNNAIVGEYPSFSMNYEKLMFSFGTLEVLHNASFANNEGVITLNWDFHKMYNCHRDDSVSVVVFNKDANQAAHLKDVALRSDKECRLDIHESWAQSELYLWVYATRGDKTSDSVFVDKLHGADDDTHGLVGTDRSVCPNEGKHLDSPTYNGIAQSIMSIIIMLYNLLGLFKQVVTATNIQIHLDALKHRTFSSMRHVNSAYKERMFSHNLRRAFECLYIEYQCIFTPMPIMSYSSNYCLKTYPHARI